MEACALLTYEPRTICVVSDEPVALPNDPHFVNVLTNADTVTSPATKRDIAWRTFPHADVYAYLDDDAYPPPHWLDEAARVLAEYPNAAGAGGPGLMPDDQAYLEQVSAAVMEMRAGSGPLRFRFWRDAARDCDDFPAYDLFVRKEWLDAVGGWATDWYGGEDTALCARMADKGGMVRYDPRLAVFHYRRRLLPDHAWQIANVGRSRGCFIRTGDPRSRRLVFGMPLAFCLSAIALVVVPLLVSAPPYAFVPAAYAYLVVAFFGHPGVLPLRVRLALPAALIVHHAAYTWGLCAGLASGRRTTRRQRAASGFASAESTVP